MPKESSRKYIIKIVKYDYKEKLAKDIKAFKRQQYGYESYTNQLENEKQKPVIIIQKI